MRRSRRAGARRSSAPGPPAAPRRPGRRRGASAGRRARSHSATTPRSAGHCGASCATKGRKVEVDEQQDVAGVTEDVEQLLGEQPRIEGVADRAEAGHAEVDLDVTMGVPRERGDAVARADAEGQQRVGETLGAAVDLTIVRAMDRPLDAATDDLLIAEHPRGVADQRGDQQGRVVHEAAHAGTLEARRAAVNWPGSALDRRRAGRVSQGPHQHDRDEHQHHALQHAEQRADLREGQHLCRAPSADLASSRRCGQSPPGGRSCTRRPTAGPAASSAGRRRGSPADRRRRSSTPGTGGDRALEHLHASGPTQPTQTAKNSASPAVNSASNAAIGIRRSAVGACAVGTRIISRIAIGTRMRPKFCR